VHSIDLIRQKTRDDQKIEYPIYIHKINDKIQVNTHPFFHCKRPDENEAEWRFTTASRRGCPPRMCLVEGDLLGFRGIGDVLVKSARGQSGSGLE
jgi:hypothetical protein